MNFRCVSIALCLVASAASGATECESTKNTQAYNTCLVKSLSSDFEPTKVDNGQWVYSLQPLAENEKRTTFVATLLSSSKLHYLDSPVALTIRCNEKKTEMEIHWDGIMIQEGETDISYHLDGSEVQRVQWPLSVAQQSLFVSNPGKFIQQLSEKKEFRLKIASQSTPTINATFNLMGLSNLLPHMTNACFK